MLHVKRGLVKNLRSPTKPVQFAKALCFAACAICHRCRIKFRVSLRSQQVNLIFKYKNAECKAGVAEEFAQPDQTWPICNGPMLRSMRHLPSVQNKVPRQPKKPKSEVDI